LHDSKQSALLFPPFVPGGNPKYLLSPFGFEGIHREMHELEDMALIRE